MIVSTTDELRLYSPANAIDNIETLKGVLDIAEHEFLEDKLGSSLYELLCKYYKTLAEDEQNVTDYVYRVMSGNYGSPIEELLSLGQRITVYAALGMVIDLQGVSVNGSGVNIAVADDYQKADQKSVEAYKKQCMVLAHAAINSLFLRLELWTKHESAVPLSEEEGEDYSKAHIVELWRESRYYYLAASLLIPSSQVLQEYLDIYYSREKFILMLPDLTYIQEDILSHDIGVEFMAYLVQCVMHGTQDRTVSTIIHSLRKIMARLLEMRTQVIKVTETRKKAATDEYNQLWKSFCEYIAPRVADLPAEALEAFRKSPLYAPEKSEDSAATANAPAFQNNTKGKVIFVTPMFN